MAGALFPVSCIFISGSLGTAGRECNNTSMDTDGCDIMCCGRGYTTDVIQRVDKCECKFHWCCEVVCKNCTRTVERHTCKGPNPTPPPRIKNNYIRFKRDDALWLFSIWNWVAAPWTNCAKRIYPRNRDWQAWLNSEDPDQTPQNAVSDLGLHCLPLIHQVWSTLTVNSKDVFKFKNKR